MPVTVFLSSDPAENWGPPADTSKRAEIFTRFPADIPWSFVFSIKCILPQTPVTTPEPAVTTTPPLAPVIICS